MRCPHHSPTTPRFRIPPIRAHSRRFAIPLPLLLLHLAPLSLPLAVPTPTPSTPGPTPPPSHPPFRLRLPLLLLLLVLLSLAACVSTPPPDAPAPAPLVLVSIDGFRADYLDAGLAPNLSTIASEGVRAQWMNPSYPSLTFPNHYSIVTGLRPDHHGIVHNTMRDAEL